jgi:pyruvate formate lyase activating enzyme
MMFVRKKTYHIKNLFKIILCYNEIGDGYMKEVMFYEQMDDGFVKCHICQHKCVIKKHKRGICGVRENIDGKLYALNDLTVALNIDPIEKKPLYYFLPNTNTYSIAAVGCNMKCPWCQNHHISQVESKKDISGEKISPMSHIQNALSTGCESISYTYTEPTIYFEYAYEIMKLAKEYRFKNIWVSNGYMSNEVLQAITPYLDAINIDVKAFDDDLHYKYCHAYARPIRKNIEYLYQQAIHIELTTLVVPGMNDDLKELKKIADYIYQLDPKIPWHISRFFPAWKMKHEMPTNIQIMKEIEKYANSIGLERVHLGNI